MIPPAPPRRPVDHLERAAVRALMRLPEPALYALAGGKPAPVDGNTLDAQLALGIALARWLGRDDVTGLAPPEARLHVARTLGVFAARPTPMAAIDDLVADHVPVRVYRPTMAADQAALVFFHGGGGVIGSVAEYEAPCTAIAARAGITVISVDYRLAPEHPFPAGLDDAFGAYRWACENAADLGLDPGRIAVGGESIGGNFAAIVSRWCRDGRAPLPVVQWLVYPWVDATRSCASIDTFATGYVLTRALIDWFLARYLPPEADLRHPDISPLHATELSGLPPAVVVTAGFDPLRDEGEMYAQRLHEADVPTRSMCANSLVHGFLSMTGAIDAARLALELAIDALAERLR